MSLLEIQNLSLKYGEKQILENLNLVLNKGDFIGIQGSSGCGKSSLFFCITEMIPSFIEGGISGKVQFSGKPTDFFGVVFQNPDTQLFFHTVEQELAFGMEQHGFSKAEMSSSIDEILDLLDLTSYRFHNPSKLSGGQKQLLILGCALTLKPKVLLLDEAFSHVDVLHREKIFPLLKSYVKEGNAILMIEHQPEHLALCSCVYTLVQKQLRKDFPICPLH